MLGRLQTKVFCRVGQEVFKVKLKSFEYDLLSMNLGKQTNKSVLFPGNVSESYFLNVLLESLMTTV
jgi:hypothetical protein